MIFRWLRDLRRARLCARPFPADWEEVLRRNLGAYSGLTEEERSRLRKKIQIFVAEKNWEGCGGLEMIDEIKVTIAAHACLLVLGLGGEYYDRVESILVYPDSYVVPRPTVDDGGPVEESGRETLGEAWYRGPVVLSWADLLDDVRHHGEGTNVAIHEFAHKLDMLDGAVDGTPPLGTREEYRRWAAVMTEEFDRLVTAFERGKESLLDPYGAVNEGEFFAVASECFFERPVEMSETIPRLYEVLRDFYRQDPATRSRG